MTQPIIELDGVSVCYRLPKEQIISFKEYAIRWLGRRITYHELWALRDLSLSVQPGEVVGVIGPNGAGKSTLLKVIARVLKPTLGRVRVVGRIGPLLELSAGFDPELTGRENIYLNGAILGLSKREVDRRFDEIVAFAELENFIDAPLRTYSSGMVARLGFAVVTDVDAEILLVDEVLAVGDESFQRKCLARIQAYREQGVSILIVSHNMQTIRDMCDRAVWISGGQKQGEGAPEAVIQDYLAGLDLPPDHPLPQTASLL
ncbi:MAG: ABC transporter ATP-binding protein [Anaerolineae bacterium]|nr:ABC transporter ATP-binding protein [Anaerolineae bacterium]